ncbi:BPI fold-containing family B member 6-like [Pelobates fuscus]|uniref:BPI fold-containing family B member 6-like n=1 Tax=Pelobates fuscus TaxID=191477 RepID=UPI002FE45D4E
MKNFLDKNLKLLLPKTLCPAVDLVLSIVNEKMCTKNISFPFGKDGSLLYSVSLLPTVTEEHIEIEFNATVKQGDVLIQPSKNATEIFDLPSNPGETSFFLKADFLGCAFTALQQEGAFNLIATESELADAETMSISALSDVIPEFPTDIQDFKITISVDKPAEITLDPSKALLHLYSNFEMTASPSPDSEPQSIFVIHLHMNFQIQFSVDEKTLHFDLSPDKIFPSLDSSSIGVFEVEDLGEFILSVLQEVYTPAINNMLQTAIPLPDMLRMLSINLAESQIEVMKNFLMISVNVCRA